MPEILINIKDKLPVLVDRNAAIVGANSDYMLRFEFDDNWQDGEKDVYIIRANGYVLEPLKTKNDTVMLPPLYDINGRSHVLVGVRQGDIKTSRACTVPLYPAITDSIEDDAVQPEPSLWEDIMKRLERLEKYGGGGSGLAYEIGFGLNVSEDYVLSAEVGTSSFKEIPNTKVQEIFNKVMED